MRNKLMLHVLLICLGLLAPWVAIQALVAPPQADGKTLIVMGGSPLPLRNTARQDMEIAFNSILDETLHHPDFRLHLIVYQDEDEVVAAFKRCEIDAFFGTPLEYVLLQDYLGEDAMAMNFRDGGVKQKYIVVARKNGIANQLKDFREKKLSLPKLHDTEALYLNTLLLRNGLPEIPEFFSQQLEAKSTNIAVMDVFFGRSDLTVIQEREFNIAKELNPQLGKQLVILHESIPLLPAIASVRKTIDPEKIRTLMKAMEEISDIHKGGKILQITQANSIVMISRDEMRSMLELKQEYETLKQARGRKEAMVLETGAKSGAKRGAR